MARRMQWIDNAVDLDVASAGNIIAKLYDLEIGTRAGFDNTLTRIVLRLQVFPTTLTETAGAQHVFYGIGVAPFDTVDAGGVGLPSPTSNFEFPESGWLVRSSRVVIAGGSGNLMLETVEEDLGAQRRLHNGSVYLSLGNLGLVSTAFSVTVTGFIRILMRLP